MVIFTKNEDETVAAGVRFGKTLTSGSVAALCGGLGAGKTAFTRGIALGLGIDALVSSPTFTIVNEYHGEKIPLFHFDLYRLSGEDELYDIGWDDYLERGGVCVVEWSEIAPGALPPDTVTVNIGILDGGMRKISIERISPITKL